MSLDTQDQPAALDTSAAVIQPGQRFELVDLAHIAPPVYNRAIDPAKLQDLAASIKATGVHQAILLRPLPGARVPDTDPGVQFEIVCGERRWRACGIAGLAFIPALVREMSDDQAREAQLIENLQREDLTELEEAEGYDLLMKHSGLTAQQVADKIGGSKGTVYARLKLLALCTGGRDALRSGKLDASRALLIARIPTEPLQLKALGEITATNGYDDQLRYSYREAARHIQQNYMLRLDQARFKITDATLCPDAGSCRECHKRTGHDPELFADVEGKDTCTDPTCFHAKQEAHDKRVRKEALDRGQTVIDGKEARSIMPSAYRAPEGYKRLDDKSDSPTDKPLRKLIGKEMEAAGIQPVLVADPHHDGKLVAMLPEATVVELLKAKAPEMGEQEGGKVAERLARDERYAKERAKEERERAYETRWRWSTLEAVVQKLRAEDAFGVPDGVLRYVARHFASSLNTEDAKRACKLLQLGKVAPKDGLLQHVDDAEDIGALLLVLIAFRDVNHLHWLKDHEQNRGLLLAAEVCTVDLAAMKAQTRANQRADAKEAEAKAAKKAEQPAAKAPAAPAKEGGGKANGQKAKPSPAARAQKAATTVDEAMSNIAAGLRALDSGAEQGAADAAQGNDGAEVPSALPSDVQSSAQPVTGADEAEAPAAGAAAAAPTPATVVFKEGDRIRFNAGTHDGRHDLSGMGGVVVTGADGDPEHSEVLVLYGPGDRDTRDWFAADSLELVTGRAGQAGKFAVGDPVRISPDLENGEGVRSKVAGRHGFIESQIEGKWRVKFGPRASDMTVLAEADIEHASAAQATTATAKPLRSAADLNALVVVAKAPAVKGTDHLVEKPHGTPVKVNDTVGKFNKAFAGNRGELRGRQGPEAYVVEMRSAKGAKLPVRGFHFSELDLLGEKMTAAGQIGLQVGFVAGQAVTVSEDIAQTDPARAKFAGVQGEIVSIAKGAYTVQFPKKAGKPSGKHAFKADELQAVPA